jgi:hypothetical protein
LLYGIIGHGSLRLESEDDLYDFIGKSIETNGEMFSFIEFVRLEYCSTDVMNDLFDLHSHHFCQINASMWANLRARLVLPKGTGTPKQFPPLVRRGIRFDVPDGIIAHLVRECDGNVHYRHVVEVTCGSLEKETLGDHRYSGAKNVGDWETDSLLIPVSRRRDEYTRHTKNNWLCYDFKERRIVPTHYAIRTNDGRPGHSHLKSWLVDTSADGQSWREVAREDSDQLSGRRFRGTFAVAGGGECRIIRLVNIGRNHYGNDILLIAAWEVFGGLFK